MCGEAQTFPAEARLTKRTGNNGTGKREETQDENGSEHV
jgi:hypothetical protein